MQPFDLQQALSGKPVLLRNGQKAYVIDHLPNPQHSYQSLIGYYITTSNKQVPTTWHTDGNHTPHHSQRNPSDIIGMWQQTITIGKHKIPEPMRTEPPHGTVYYVPLLDTENKFYDWNKWQDSLQDDRALERGLAHYTPEAAEAHAKALIELSGRYEVYPF